jgi:hypothetical protein
MADCNSLLSPRSCRATDGERFVTPWPCRATMARSWRLGELGDDGHFLRDCLRAAARGHLQVVGNLQVLPRLRVYPEESASRSAVSGLMPLRSRTMSLSLLAGTFKSFAKAFAGWRYGARYSSRRISPEFQASVPTTPAPRRFTRSGRLFVALRACHSS